MESGRTGDVSTGEKQTDVRACTAPRVHGDAQASAATKELVWVHGPTACVLMLTSVACVTTKNHEHACSLDCYLRPH